MFSSIFRFVKSYALNFSEDLTLVRVEDSSFPFMEEELLFKIGIIVSLNFILNITLRQEDFVEYLLISKRGVLAFP
jgi:hypothetical protein